MPAAPRAAMVAGSALALMMKATKIGRNLASDERSASVLGSCTGKKTPVIMSHYGRECVQKSTNK